MTESDQACKNCYYVRQFADFKIWQCHRRSPEPYSFYRYFLGELLRDMAWSQRNIGHLEAPDERNTDMNEEASEQMSTTGWPEVDSDDWCGEWRAKPIDDAPPPPRPEPSVPFRKV